MRVRSALYYHNGSERWFSCRVGFFFDIAYYNVLDDTSYLIVMMVVPIVLVFTI